MKKESVAIIGALILLFYTLELIIYLSAIETLICHREMSLIGSTSFGFAQNTIDTRPHCTHSGIVFDKCHKNDKFTSSTAILDYGCTLRRAESKIRLCNLTLLYTLFCYIITFGHETKSNAKYLTESVFFFVSVNNLSHGQLSAIRSTIGVQCRYKIRLHRKCIVIHSIYTGVSYLFIHIIHASSLFIVIHYICNTHAFYNIYI